MRRWRMPCRLWDWSALRLGPDRATADRFGIGSFYSAFTNSGTAVNRSASSP
jgi:hypothetical protein